MKKILVLGGSKFMGRMLVEALLEEGSHDITLFNRGKTNAGLFPKVKKIIGDRETADAKKIPQKDWDLIFDFSCYHPNSLEALIQSLNGKVGRYIFMSTISVYEHDPDTVKMEVSPVLPCTAEQRAEEEINPQNYGAKKAECERILLQNDWLDSIILRPAIVYGPHDYTERFYYWLYRIKNLKQVMVPGKGEELMNMSYAEDMVTLLRKCIDIPVHRKIYNTTTHKPNSLLQKLETIAEVLGKSPRWRFVETRKILDDQERLKGKIPQIFTTSNHYRSDYTLMVEDFGEFITPFKKSVERTVNWHNTENHWEEGTAGPTVDDEINFIKFLKN